MNNLNYDLIKLLLYQLENDFNAKMDELKKGMNREEEKKIPEKLDYIHPDIQCSYNESELLLRIEANKDKINYIIDYLKSKGE